MVCWNESVRTPRSWMPGKGPGVAVKEGPPWLDAGHGGHRRSRRCRQEGLREGERGWQGTGEREGAPLPNRRLTPSADHTSLQFPGMCLCPHHAPSLGLLEEWPGACSGHVSVSGSETESGEGAAP